MSETQKMRRFQIVDFGSSEVPTPGNGRPVIVIEAFSEDMALARAQALAHAGRLPPQPSVGAWWGAQELDEGDPGAPALFENIYFEMLEALAQRKH